MLALPVDSIPLSFDMQTACLSLVLLFLVCLSHGQLDHVSKVRDCNHNDVFCLDVLPDFTYSYGRYKGATVDAGSLMFRFQLFRSRRAGEHVWHFDIRDPSLTDCNLVLTLIPAESPNLYATFNLRKDQDMGMTFTYRTPGAIKDVDRSAVKGLFPKISRSSSHLALESSELVADHVGIERFKFKIRVEFMACHSITERKVVETKEAITLLDSEKAVNDAPPAVTRGSRSSDTRSPVSLILIIGVAVVAIVALVVFIVLMTTGLQVLHKTTSRSSTHTENTTENGFESVVTN